MNPFRIILATTPDHIAHARSLMLEYRDSIRTPLCFQGFDAEMQSLPGRYAPPSGVLLLALQAFTPVGCIALRDISSPASDRICEMKRLFVRPHCRGSGLGRHLCDTLLDHARALGYTAMRLDTDEDMKPAQALYEALGFTPIPRYNDDPIPNTLFFEKRLTPLPQSS